MSPPMLTCRSHLTTSWADSFNERRVVLSIFFLSFILRLLLLNQHTRSPCFDTFGWGCRNL